MDKFNIIIDVLALKNTSSRNDIPKFIRFLFCAIFTFAAFILFKGLGQLSLKEINLIFINILEPSWFVLGFIALTFSLFGLWFSIIAVAFFNSLVPKT